MKPKVSEETIERYRRRALSELKQGLALVQAALLDLSQPLIDHDIAAELRSMDPRLALVLHSQMPLVARPWAMTDMRDRCPIAFARYTHESTSIACVCRAGNQWSARVFGEVVERGAGSNWPSIDAAKAACDELLKAKDVLLLEAQP